MLEIAKAADGAVVRITLDRPEALNALDTELCERLADAVEACAGDRSVRVVVLRGAGRSFCAGGDLRHLSQIGVEGAARMIAHLYRAVLAMARSDALVLVAAKTAAGAGLSLVAAADVAIASENAKFAPAYTKAGLTPDGGLTYHLPRLVGPQRARWWILANDQIPAREAKAIDLVQDVVPDEDLDRRVLDVAERLSAGPRQAFASAKRLLLGDPEALASHLDSERDALLAQLAGNEGREGIAAFLDRRAPRFA